MVDVSAVSVDTHGTFRHFDEDGELHRTNAPAVVYSDGTKVWYHHGVRRRDGVRHRDGGPALEYPDGTKLWMLSGVEYTEEQYQLEMSRIRNLNCTINAPSVRVI